MFTLSGHTAPGIVSITSAPLQVRTQDEARVPVPLPAEPSSFENHTFGMHRLTYYVENPKEKSGAARGLGGFQMTCGYHKTCNTAKCTKSHNIDPALGGEDGTIRRLKLWALQAIYCNNKMQHKQQWAAVMRAWELDCVPSSDALDDAMLHGVFPRLMPSVHHENKPKRCKTRKS